MTTKSMLFTGTKAIALQDLPESAWQIAGATVDADDIQKRAAAVAFLYRGIEIRANALMAVPWEIRRAGPEAASGDALWISEDEDAPAQLAFLANLPQLLWQTEAAWCFKSEAFWYRERNRVQTLNMRWLDPDSMQPQWDVTAGLVGFKRRLGGGTAQTLTVEDVVYLWRQGLRETAPATSAAQAAAQAAGVLYNADEFVTQFFARGAIKATLLTVEGNPQPEEMKKLEAWWKRFFSGVKDSWATAAVKAGVTPVTVGEGLESLTDATLTAEKREDILTALGVPHSLALSNAANYACLPGDQLVYTPSGAVPIADLKTGDNIWQYTDGGVTENVITAIVPQGMAKVYEISTRTRTLRASDNHLILAVEKQRGRGGPYHKRTANLVWKRADGLARDDLIVIVEELPEGCLTDHEGIALTEPLMELLGLYLGDGDCDGRSVRIAIPQGQLQDYYANSAEQVFERTYQGYGELKAKKKEYIFAIHSSKAADLLKRLGVRGDAHTKHVPAWIFRTPKNLRLAFLRGYLDSDGTVDKRGYITFGSVNERLIQDVRLLCISCGIPVTKARIYQGESNFGKVTLWRFSCCYPEYNRLIGSHDMRYIERLSTLSNGTSNGRYVSGRYRSEGIDLPIGFGLSRVLDVRYDGEEPVYDLATIGSHTFIAEGIVVHNTAQQDEQNFYNMTIIPDCRLIQRQINRQVMAPLELRFLFKPQEMAVFQADESERSQAFKNYTDSGMKLSIVAEMLGLYLPGGIEYAALDVELPEPVVVMPTTLMPPLSPTLSPVDMAAQTEMKAFRRWLKKHPERDVDEFKPDHLSHAELYVIAAEVKETATAQPPFAWHGTGIPDAIKALILQLDPDDDEAERAIRILTEKRTRRNLQAAMDDILADITRQAPTDVEDMIRQTRTHFQRDQALYDALARALQDGADLGVSVAVQQFEAIGFGMDWTLVNTQARAWAQGYVGELIRNVESTTVDSVRQSVSRWIGNGEPLQALIDDLTPTFGAQRAERISVTEVTRAFAEANRIAYRESGVVEELSWMTARDERVCPQCGPLHGKRTTINGDFGGFFPPRHVSCRCWIIPIIEEAQ